MQIEKIKYLTKTKALVFFDNGIECILYKKEISREGLVEQEEILQEQYESIMSDIVQKRARKKIMDLLIRSDKTEKELRDRLSRDHYPDFIIDKAVKYVNKYHYIDEDRYLKNYIKYHSKGKSRRFIIQELDRKGIQKEKTLICLDEMYDETEQIQHLIKKKVKDCTELKQKEWNKIASYLIMKGFENNAVYQELRKIKKTWE